MNTPTAIVISSLALGFGGVAAYFALTPPGATAAPADASPGAARRSGAELPELARSVAELQLSVEGLRDEVAMLKGGSQRSAAAISDDAIARAVAAYMEANGPATVAAVPAASRAGQEELGSAEDIFAMLGSADPTEAMGLWKRIVEEGLDDEVLALFKAAAEAAPNDPAAQLALGQAYLGRTQEATGPMAGMYATFADKALNKALELDPQHWEARYTKATALSFWPPNLGKQPEAIREFETLIQQQSGMGANPQHASTHFMLGNLYQQNGQPERALEVWRAGLALYPNNEQLAQQLQLSGG